MAPSTQNRAQPPWQRGQRGSSFNVSCLVADIPFALFSCDVPVLGVRVPWDIRRQNQGSGMPSNCEPVRIVSSSVLRIDLPEAKDDAWWRQGDWDER